MSDTTMSEVQDEQSTINVRIAEMAGDSRTVTVPAGSTVNVALENAGITPNASSVITMNGATVDAEDVLVEGATLVVVGKVANG